MLYSLDDLDGFKRTSNGLYDIFGTTVIYDIEQNFYVYVVLPEHEMRLDLICDYLYTHTDFIEELMVVNNIYNPWNIKEGDEILYFSPENLMILHGGKDDDSAFDKLTKFQEKTVKNLYILSSRYLKKAQLTKKLSSLVILVF